MPTFDNSPQKNPLQPLVKINQIAKILALSNPTIHKLIDSGDLKAAPLGPSTLKARRHVRVTRASLLKFYRKRCGHSLLDALTNPVEP